jgi:hypothetical protein
MAGVTELILGLEQLTIAPPTLTLSSVFAGPTVRCTSEVHLPQLDDDLRKSHRAWSGAPRRAFVSVIPRRVAHSPQFR